MTAIIPPRVRRGDTVGIVAPAGPVRFIRLVRGVERKGPIIRTESIVLRARSGTIRRVSADHLVQKWLGED